MINIVMIAPYEQSRPFIQGVVDRYESSQPINVTVHVFKNEEIPLLSISGDAIIARGFNMKLIKDQCKNIPVFPLDVSGYDIIKAVTTAKQNYGDEKIAIIGPREMVDSVENIQEMLNMSINLYRAEIDTLDDVLKKAHEDGCTCFVGGLSVIECCQPSDHKVLVKVGKSSIVNSLNEAIRTVNILREHQKLSELFKTIVNYSKDGIISVDEKGIITSINLGAQAYLYLGIGAIGKPVEKLLPFAKDAVTEIMKNGKKIKNEIYNVNDRMFTTDYIPLNKESNIGGIVIFIRSVDRIQQDESLLRKKMVLKKQQAKYTFDNIIHLSPSLSQTIDMAKMYAKVDSPVLIIGESGTGKELFAQSIHNYSNRKDGPFIGINCAALNESLLESELFGYTDGSFTGAIKGGREGLFEAAHGGTLFLDEISEIPISFQSKLLRVLQENEVRRVGDQKITSIDVRILAATNRDLNEYVKSGLFRQDLFFRLNVLPLQMMPLRARPEDIIELFESYLKEYGKRYGRPICVITGEAKQMLRDYSWYGNARELKNIAERICVLNIGNKVNEDIVSRVLYGDKWANYVNITVTENSCANITTPNGELANLNLLLKQYNGNKTKVAQYLGIDRTTLWRKLKRLESE